ncbi:hypothetical protein KQX54_013185 [Cotesia glomerata]|uniref:Uncharacterized protein n=1 Tax=Cotesia glomerata TaxID=32391 RepID=A0AAV7J5H1_COTGL|nr:hypothetical protein KQX54_013185 [Cotesia glomerata]
MNVKAKHIVEDIGRKSKTEHEGMKVLSTRRPISQPSSPSVSPVFPALFQLATNPEGVYVLMTLSSSKIDDVS